ncbi:choice-of-anchor L domain-containing protein [Flavobacterium sp.]|uniref:T9SS type B sorting domain-containing protein n=1 Tax=Flavobacterium sp. TaxID=239 RepID=UPI0035285278
MKILLTYSITFFGFLICFSQTITVDDTYSSENLVDVLLNNPCAEINNISMSAGQSVAYFNQNGSTFPLTEGVLIRNGIAAYTAGTYTNTNVSSPLNNDTDTFLQNLSLQSSGQNTPIRDVAFLEFDFIPSFNSFSFNFLFASNEYGEYQCISNDIFAFALTDLTTGTTTNLAVVPGTTNPVTVKNIRNSAYNNTCNSSNPGFFSTYNVTNPSNATLNMRGHTVVLTAGANVIPDNPYKIRLAIADYGDSDFDSAVFIAGGSFVINFDLGNDQTICSGDEYLLDTGLDNSYTFQWLQNGVVIAGATNATYTVTEAGDYTVIIDKGACHIEDTIHFTDLTINTPQNIYVCNNGSPNASFNLTTNNEAYLGIDDGIYDIYYYASAADVISNNPIATSDLTDFQSSGQTIYIKLFNTETDNFCDAEYTFDLIITNAVIAPTNITTSICSSSSNLSYDLAVHNTTVINGQTGDYTISYYTTENDAISASNAINSSISIPSGITTITYWIRIEDTYNPNCFDVTPVAINLLPLPVIDSIENIVACSTTTLPTITNGSYFSEANGSGINLGQGGATPVIEDGGIYYIFAGPDANGCTNQTSFTITFIDEYTPTLDNCGSFTVPLPPEGIGAFYSEAGGPNGSGTLIPSGTLYENNTNATIIQPIYYYAEIDDVVCRDELFNIHIHPLPELEEPNDVTYCDSYTLPALTNGNYFTNVNGTGTPLFAGDVISTTQIVHVYNEVSHINHDGTMGICGLDYPFIVNIIDTGIFTNITACGAYTLPTITFGGYYTQPGGQGTSIDPSVPITSSQIVYYYANTTELPNCTENLNFNITINPLPLVDEIASATYCGEYVLPELNNGTYYLLSGGSSTPDQVQLFSNTVIDLSGTALAPGTYYVYNGPDSNGCTNEWSFTITINPNPVTDEVLNSIECNPYSITTPTNGTIYTATGGPNGTGTVVNPSDIFNEDNTFYMYNEDAVTGCIVDNPFTVFYNGINLPDYQNIAVCDTENYQLPILTHIPPEATTNYTIGYFYETGGVNPIPNGSVFNTPGTYTIYVYAVNNGRFGISCVEEDSFVITVSETPSLPDYSVYNGNYCTSFTLPTLPAGNYNVNYYSASGGSAATVINPSNYTYSIQANDAPTTYDIWVYATANNNTTCMAEQHFQFTLYPPLEFTIPDGIICVDPVTGNTLEGYVLESGLNPSLYTVEWYLNNSTNLVGNGVTYTALEAGTYTAVPVMLSPENPPNCNYLPAQVTVTQSSTAVASVQVTLPFENIATAIVTLENGFGSYLYSLDGNDFDTNNEFYDLSSGEHNVTIRDVYGNCGDYVVNFTVVKYPKFFTPNADGYNDYWNIWDLRKDYPNAVISIFDRYGKLLKQISPLGIGWDGNYNGHQLPSTDYWFTVDFLFEQQEKQFKSHFSMKR